MSLYFELQKAFYGQIVKPFDYTPQFRFEGFARDENNINNLAMVTADPLWMLGRQWQFGEFIGEDNGSPISVAAQIRKQNMPFYSSGEEETPRYRLNDIPLEAVVEAMEYIPGDLRTRVKIGQQYMRVIKRRYDKGQAKSIIKEQIAKYPLSLEDGKKYTTETLQFFKQAEGASIDGISLLNEVKENGIPMGGDELEAEKKELLAWFNNQYLQGGSIDAWKPNQLFHQFSIHGKETTSSNENISLEAPDYQSGQLDWYSFDKAKVEDVSNIVSKSLPAEVPIHLSFRGMPTRRLFAFEDGKIDLGSMNVETDDLIRLMMLQFSLASGGDWYTLSLPMKIGEACWVDHIKVTDVFNVTTTIRNNKYTGPVIGKDIDGDDELTGLDVWDVFKVRDKLLKDYQVKDHFLFLAPVARSRQESAPVEEVLFLRDEFANVAWGIEKRIRNELGKTVDGFGLHLEINGPFQDSAVVDQEDTQNIPEFRLASTVPTNWIPYFPLLEKHEAKDIGLHRALIEDIVPLSHLIGQELLHLREEAIPKTGRRVQLTRQRMRWTDGKTYIWLGRKVLVGKGEGNSGLRFDYLKR